MARLKLPIFSLLLLWWRIYFFSGFSTPAAGRLQGFHPAYFLLAYTTFGLRDYFSHLLLTFDSDEYLSHSPPLYLSQFFLISIARQNALLI
jgi:hypothetical protein